MAGKTDYFYDFHYPLPFVELILKLLGKKQDGTTQLTDTANREWFSQPRLSSSGQTDCITVNFRLPLSVSEISTEILRMPCLMELWYQDRSNNWRPILDTQRTPLKVNVSRSDTASWYKYFSKCYPIVAKKVQFRITRTNDPAVDGVPYPVGMRNTLIRRNVYDRDSGGSFEDEVDIMGNVVSKYIKDWDAQRAADDNYLTFWRSAPQPDPAAVVSLYLDVRDDEGRPQVIDKIYLDPVYSGQHLNLYYSIDSLVGTRFLSPITLGPATGTEEDPTVSGMEWRSGQGLRDSLDIDDTDSSFYTWPLSIGPLPSQDGWIGVEWRPGFESANVELNHNPILFQAEQVSGKFKPTLLYDPENRTFELVLGTGHVYTSSAISQEFVVGDSLRIIAGWRYVSGGDDVVVIKVTDQRGRVLASLNEDTELPEIIGFDGTCRVADFRGILPNLIIKLENPELSSESFLKNPLYYVDPDPVIADESGSRPVTSLNNAIYAAPFIAREHGSGGSDSSHFEDKEWTPIWRDYTAVRGMLHLPKPVSMSYLKLEFTNLTEQPYPIYEAGIETSYKVFPIQVTQQSSIGPKLYTGGGGFLGMGTFISMNGTRSVNWLDPVSVMQAVGSVLGPQTPPVIISTATPYIVDKLPNNGTQAVDEQTRIEAASAYVYPREALNPYILAQDQYNTTIKAEGLQAIQPYVDVPWEAIEAANPGSVTKVRSTGTVPIRGTDWWIYPGQQIKVPASVMTKLTSTETVTERKLTLENRTRFNTTSVHHYETRTVKRDAAIAYFAGIREVQPYTSTYITGEDRPYFEFPSYDATQWTYVEENAQKSPQGPISARYPNIPLIISKHFETQSEFVKVSMEFQDSGLLKSNSMWADIDQAVAGIEDTRLSPYVNTVPANIPGGNWADDRAVWLDPGTVWGAVRGLVSINVDSDRRYQGRRVLHFTRAAGSGEAGISLDQWTNFVPGAQFRMGAVFYRPNNTDNELVMTLTRSDGVEIHREVLDYAPVGRWFERTTQFVEIPETLPNNTFDSGLLGWVPLGGSWAAETAVGRSGTKSARLTTNGTLSSLTSSRMQSLTDTVVTASAWVRWQDLTPGTDLIYLQVLMYDNDDELVSTHTLENKVSPGQTTMTSWLPVSGSVTVPDNQGVTQVAFRILVAAAAGTGGKVWVDDFATDVPGAPRQQFTAALTVVGDEEESLYVSDLYTEVTPVRYFARLGTAPEDLIEVTDLRYTKGVATVTSSQPVNTLDVQAVINSPRAWAFGCKITPAYLK